MRTLVAGVTMVLHTLTEAEWLVGRVREGQYELPALNGWMTPYRARTRCDRDQTCGGFTYKGFITSDQTQKFKIFFFHLVLNYEDDLENWNWVTYKAEREFLVFANKTDPAATFLSGGKQLPLETAKRWKCVGLQERDGEAALVSSASINNLETDQEGRSTLIKLELPYSGAGVGLGDGDSYQDIDRCCPASNLSQWEDFVRVSLQSPEVLPVLDCGLEPSKFREEKVVRSEMVKVLGCGESWPAREWTIKSLLERDEASWRWRTNFVDQTGRVGDTSEQGKFRLASEILDMIERNLTVRLFDDIGVHETVMRLRRGEEAGDERTDKRELRQEYSMPAIIGQDIFETCQILTDYQWTLLSGPNTGTDLHQDPAFANSWNTLLSGHKVWAVLPPDTEFQVFSCDPQCSHNEEEISPLAWFQHVLPQLEGRLWYGQGVRTVLQRPGDTLVIPSTAPHAVINLDWSLGVTENVLTEEMLLDLPHKLLLGGSVSPDTEAWPGERREERLWKCLTRSGVLDSSARRRLRGGERQSLEKISQRENVCWNKMTGTRPWLKEMGIGIQAEPITVNRT